MFILDSILIGGLRFVLDKVATVVDAELNDDTALREQLMAAQMRVELAGSILAERHVRGHCPEPASDVDELGNGRGRKTARDFRGGRLPRTFDEAVDVGRGVGHGC